MASKGTQEKGKPREFEINRADNMALYEVRFKGGGQLPKDLKGALFTSPTVAQKAIDAYLEAK